MIHIPILYQSGPVEVEDLADDREEDYSLRMGAVCVEFSEVEETDNFLRLHTSTGFSGTEIIKEDLRRDVKGVLLGL